MDKAKLAKGDDALAAKEKALAAQLAKDDRTKNKARLAAGAKKRQAKLAVRASVCACTSEPEALSSSTSFFRCSALLARSSALAFVSSTSFESSCFLCTSSSLWSL